jgi:peptide-methionine (S)-S-oxide reductase
VSGVEEATLGGGCFWCLEAVFEQLEGVREVKSGYAGGSTRNPTYEQVCTGRTGHAEVVQVTFDPEALSYHDLLEVFFAIHDPTTLNRQGADVGTQYRSAIFTHSQQQADVARKVLAELSESGTWRVPVVTEIVPLTEFYPAEGYHDQYYRLNPDQPYCRIVIGPKLAKFRKRFADRVSATR